MVWAVTEPPTAGLAGSWETTGAWGAGGGTVLDAGSPKTLPLGSGGKQNSPRKDVVGTTDEM